LEVRPNSGLLKPAGISVDFASRQKSLQQNYDTVTSKSKKQINKLLAKDQLTNRDMIKLSKLMEKESAASLNDSVKNSLEIKDHTKHIIDKDANKKDSTYWANIRPIPLSDIELQSLRISDSTKAARQLVVMKSDTVTPVKNKEKSKFIKTASEIISGHTWSDKTGFSFNFNGLTDLKSLSFNSVDGFKYGLNFSISKPLKKVGGLFVAPHIQWTFSRHQLLWGINSTFSFNKLKNNQVFLRMGSASVDLNTGAGINPLINSLTSLLLKQNYLRLYESRYLTMGYSTEIINGLRLNLTIDYENRNILHNTTNFSIFKSSKLYSENVPANNFLLPGSNEINVLRDQKHYDFISQIIYTPYQKYRIYKGIKAPADSDWPTFYLTWQHSMNDFSEISNGLRQFDMIKFEVSRNHSIGAFGNFRWRIKTAGYFDNRNLTYYDFFHFNSQPFPLLLNNYEDAFMIPQFYSQSTPEFFVEGHLKYTTPYLLLKLLPGLSNTLTRENLSLSYLGSRYQTNYTEIGYSLSDIFFLGEVGIYMGFDDVKYRSAGVRAILNFH